MIVMLLITRGKITLIPTEEKEEKEKENFIMQKEEGKERKPEKYQK